MRIGVIGIGKLGLCLALTLERCGFDVVGYDIRQDHVDSLIEKKFNSVEPLVNDFLQSSSIKFTNNINIILTCDIVFIMTNTPSKSTGEFNHEQINSVLDDLKYFSNLIVICSTVMPGYCDSLNDTRIIYSPQFVAQGSIIENQKSPDIVLIGHKNKEGLETIKSIYRKLYTNTPVYKSMDWLSAEITKLALNCYITTKISFANMLGDICNVLGANSKEVLSAIGSDSRVGSKCFSYGYGYGGPCFPRDNKAFINFTKLHKIEPFISKATESTNENHLLLQLELISNGIYPDNVEINGDSAIITGVCFKGGSEILDESQQLKLALKMIDCYKITIKESKCVVDELKSKYGDVFSYEVK